MEIKIYGQYCTMYDKLLKNIRSALKRIGMKVEIVEVTKTKDIYEAGIHKLPSLAVNGKIIAEGTVLSQEELLSFLQPQ